MPWPMPWPMPDLEVMSVRFRAVLIFCSLDFLQGYWLIPLVEEAQDWFTLAPPHRPEYTCPPRFLKE